MVVGCHGAGRKRPTSFLFCLRSMTVNAHILWKIKESCHNRTNGTVWGIQSLAWWNWKTVCFLFFFSFSARFYAFITSWRIVQEVSCPFQLQSLKAVARGAAGAARAAPLFQLFFFFFFFFFVGSLKQRKRTKIDVMIHSSTQRVSLNKGSMIAFIAIVLCRSAAAMPRLG